MSSLQVVATVVFLPPQCGGRSSPVSSGYRGQFFYLDRDCDVVHRFEFPAGVPFGEEVADFIDFLNDSHRRNLKEGTPFLIREGLKTVAYGVVVAVN